MRRRNQALVLQVAQHQQLGLCAQRHQGHQFTFVDVNCQRTLSGNGNIDQLAELIDRLGC